MARFLGFGNSSTPLDLSGYTVIKATCSGASGAISLTATGSFVAGQRLFIWQTRGTGAGAYEDNTVASYTTGEITLVHSLENTYTDSGVSQAQVLVVPEASSVTGTLTVPAWDGDVGGLFVVACSGTFGGTINANVKGFRGGAPGSTGGSAALSTQSGYSGESYSAAQNANGGGYATDAGGAVTPDTAAQGNGGSGGRASRGQDGASGGAGGGNGTSGANGGGKTATSYPFYNGGYAGAAVGSAELSALFMGGGGGGPGGEHDANIATAGSYYGGTGGGGIVIYAKTFSPVSLTANAANGANYGNARGGSGAGAGGFILVKTTSATLGSGIITASGGTGGSGISQFGPGGNGGSGRIRIEACSSTGSTSPTASQSTGGHDFCSIATGMI